MISETDFLFVYYLSILNRPERWGGCKIEHTQGNGGGRCNHQMDLLWILPKLERVARQCPN